jgi:hypothetical protein
MINPTKEQLKKWQEENICKWERVSKLTRVSWTNYFTECGQIQSFCGGDIEENDYVYCPYCGRRILEI